MDFAKVLAEIARFLDARKARYLAFVDSLGYERLHVSEGYDHTADLLFTRAVKNRIFAGVEMPVPSPEHIAAMKVQAMKNDRTRTLKEMADVQYLPQLPGVDEAEVRRYFDEAGLSERFDEIKALANDRDPGDAR